MVGEYPPSMLSQSRCRESDVSRDETSGGCTSKVQRTRGLGFGRFRVTASTASHSCTAPLAPQAEGVVPGWHPPVESQHPLQVTGGDPTVLWITIARVSNDGVPDESEVAPDLVFSTTLGPNLEIAAAGTKDIHSLITGAR